MKLKKLNTRINGFSIYVELQAPSKAIEAAILDGAKALKKNSSILEESIPEYFKAVKR
jgi:hypothetical protein